VAAHEVGARTFFGTRAPLAKRKAFAAFLTPLRRIEWVVYSKRPFGGPQAVLAYPSRYTHRVAISNRRLIAFDEAGVTFKWKDYRATGRERAKVMTLAADEFIRRFLIHVLPTGFHRIRHYGLFASGKRAENIARARRLRRRDSSKAGFARDRKGSPASVRPTLRVVRMNSAAPTRASSGRTAWLIADGVTPSSAAPRRKLRCCATFRNASTPSSASCLTVKFCFRTHRHYSE
jgi:hypothetical protein